MSITDPSMGGFARTNRGEVRAFELWPHRSLDRRGLQLLFGVTSLGFLVVTARHGGPAVVPIGIACLATYAFLAWAFWSNNRSARFAERIEISSDAVRVVRYGPAVKPLRAEFNTHWVRVVLADDRQVANRLLLKESGRGLSIGEFLSSDERAKLAAELRDELARMRRATA